MFELKFQKFQNENDSLLLNTNLTTTTTKKSTIYDKTKKSTKMSTLKNEEYVLDENSSTATSTSNSSSSSSSTSSSSTSSNESLEFENQYSFNKINESNHLSKSSKIFNKTYELKLQDSLAKESRESESILKPNKENEYVNNKYKNKKNKKRVKLNILEQKKETCDKSTATIHEVATQTDKEKSNMGTNTDDNHHNHNLLLHLNPQQSKSLPKQSVAKSNTDHSNINNNNLSPNNSKSKGSNKSSSPNLEYLDRAQIDGKQYLLETYLRNNNEVTSASTSSSGPLLLKKSTNIMQMSNTRESGIGTVNDDECEMESLHSFDENLTDLTDHKNTTKNELDDEHENSSINVRTSHSMNNVKLRRKPKSIKSKHQKLKDEQKLNNIINNDKYDLIEDLKSKEPFDEIENAMSIDDDIKVKSSDQKSYWSDFLKKLCTFFLLIFPFIFLFFVYYVYNYYLNPSCCDFKRNYLLINIT